MHASTSAIYAGSVKPRILLIKIMLQEQCRAGLDQRVRGVETSNFAKAEVTGTLDTINVKCAP